MYKWFIWKNKEISFSFELPQEKINRATNENSDNTLWNINAQIENTKEIIQKIEKTAYSGETVTLTFKEIIVGQKVRINIDLTQDGETTPSYTGSSDWFIVKKDENKINISLNKVTSNENNEPPTIVDAAEPQINVYPTSKVEIATENNLQEELTETLSVNATSTDGGTLSFIWQEKNPDNTWQKFEPITTTTDSDRIESSIEVTVKKGNSKTFKCIITNTNNSVNGNKTATIETNEVTVAYVEGQLASIKAQYIGEYEKFNYEDFYSNEKVTVTETYTSGTNNQTSITFDASENRYDIQKVNNDEKAIGYVPYTVSCISSTNITTNLTVPVKYQLNANDFVITGSNQNNGNQEKIAQFTGNTTLEVVTSEASNVPSKIYENKDENSATAEDYDILQNLQSVWKLENQQIIDTTVNNAVAKTYQYTNTLTVPTENSWCVGDPIELEYEVEVCPWKIALNTEDGNTVDLNILTGNTTYTLSATNEAVANPNVTWESSDSSVFNVRGSTLTTPTATTTENQTAKITAKVGDKEIGSVEVTVQGNPEYHVIVSSWSKLQEEIGNIPEDTYTEENPYVIAINNSNEYNVSSCINVTQPVKIIPLENVTITRLGTKGEFFFTTAYFEIAGTQTAKITFNGESSTDAQQPIIIATSSLKLSYCDFNNNINTSTDGGAICVTENETSTINVNLSNCNFNNNSVTNTVNGGAVALYGKSIISQINNCTFTNNKATNGSGGALYIYGTTVENTEKIHTLKDCSFSNNQTSSESGKGGALYLDQGTLILDGITMTGNKNYQNNNSDIFVNNNYCYVTLENNNKIDCFIDQFGSQYNPVIQLGDNFSTESKINFLCVASSGASVEDGDKLIATTQLTSEQIACFQSITDEEGTSWTLNSDGTITKAITGGSSGGTITANVQVSTWSNLKTEIASITGTTYTEENPYVIEITGNMNTEDSTVEVITVSSHVKLVSNSDCTITRTSAFASVNLFQVNSEASLTIGDANAGGTLTLDGGGTDVSATASLIKVSGTLVLNEKSVLQNNNCKEAYGTSGSAVYSNGGTIKVSGATINNNSNKYSSSYGGAIYIKNGTLNITSGLFENNSTYKNGGAIYVTGGTVNITGGEFTNNIVSSGSYKTETGYGGSAIYIDSATTSISSVEFKNNITYDGVGTLLVTNIGDENTPATINNCTFNNNKAYQNGAAIYTGGASYIEITSCNFTENTVTNTDSTTGTGTGEQSDVYIGNNSGWTKIDGTEYSEAWSSN